MDGKVYDVTTFVESHPGGPELVTELAGMDASHECVCIAHLHCNGARTDSSGYAPQL